MPLKIGVGGVPLVTVSSSEVDIVDKIGNSFERATVFVEGDVTATLTIRFYGKPEHEYPDWFQIGDDVTQEPNTKKAYVCSDLFADLKVRAVRAGSGDCDVRASTLWEKIEGSIIKRDKGTRP